MSNLTIEGRARKLPDIQRTWLWELVIPSITDVTGGVIQNVEDLIVRCRTAVIPARGTEGIQSSFMGMTQWFPSKPTFTQTFDVTIEETEDQIVHKALTAWSDILFNTDPTAANGGSSTRPLKRDMAKDIYLVMYTYDQREMKKKIRFYNAYPENVGDVTLDYTDNASVKFGCVFRYDFWRLV
jgi:hypothetical protein